MKHFFTILFIMSTTASVFAQTTGAYAGLNNRDKDRGIVVILGEAARQAFDLLEMPTTEKIVKSCSVSYEHGAQVVEEAYEMKMGTNITCERKLEKDSYACYLPFNVKNGGLADKKVQTLDFPCGKSK